jgi:uncharacterized lipoprotein NlpE involved in copper resistance
MKKASFLLVLAVVILVAGCNEKKLLDNLDGTWVVQKYLYNNGDKTTQFKADKVDFKWQFSKDKNYTESWEKVDTIKYDRYDSAYVKDVSGLDSLSNIDTVPTFYLNEQSFFYKGVWTLVNSNKFLQLRREDSTSADYRIIEHTSSSLKLFKGNEEFWLEAK